MKSNEVNFAGEFDNVMKPLVYLSVNIAEKIFMKIRKSAYIMKHKSTYTKNLSGEHTTPPVEIKATHVS